MIFSQEGKFAKVRGRKWVSHRRGRRGTQRRYGSTANIKTIEDGRKIDGKRKYFRRPLLWHGQETVP